MFTSWILFFKKSISIKEGLKVGKVLGKYCNCLHSLSNLSEQRPHCCVLLAGKWTSGLSFLSSYPISPQNHWDADVCVDSTSFVGPINWESGTYAYKESD